MDGEEFHVVVDGVERLTLWIGKDDPDPFVLAEPGRVYVWDHLDNLIGMTTW